VGEEGELAGRHRVSAQRTRGEGEEARGRGRGTGEAVAGAAREERCGDWGGQR
jgi:hypothetical protein